MKFLTITLALAPTLALSEPAEAQSFSRSFYNERGGFAGSSVNKQIERAIERASHLETRVSVPHRAGLAAAGG
jgi:hypothetical protein